MSPLRSLAGAFAIVLFACSSSRSPAEADGTFPADPLVAVPSDSGALRVAIRTAPSQPPPRGTCTVEVTVTDALGAPKDGLTLEAVPWMPAHGHGAPTNPEVEAKGGGNYVVRNVDFFMPGDWELRLTFAGPLSDHAAPKITIP
jgi:hypothetical protein